MSPAPRLDFSKKTLLMGVLNITPDSFSDGGLFFNSIKAVERGLQMAKEGADIIDIGGESTRPASEGVSAEEELKRVIPVIKEIAAKVKIPVSIDTSKPAVAREALMAGASMINDVMGTPLSAEMAEIAAEFGVPIVLMHIKGAPKTMQINASYKDLLGEITAALLESIRVAQSRGIDPKKIIIDPGIGFGKTTAHNLEIIARLNEFKPLGKPIMVGPSRKSFIGAVLGINDPAERLIGTAAAVAISIANGADIVRVHDVKEMRQVSDLTDAICKKKRKSDA